MKTKYLLLKTLSTIIFFVAAANCQQPVSSPLTQGSQTENISISTATPFEYPKPENKPKYVRGIHLTSWVTGSKKARENIDRLLNETEINTVVIDLKEYEGEVYIPGVALAEEYKTYTAAMPNLKEYIADLKSRNIFTIARIVVFKDNKLVKVRPDLAVKSSEGGVWQDRAKNTWLDPYNKKNWDYTFAIAKKAIEMGFQEIQFDYIRFPSDGNTKTCRYSQKHSSMTTGAALAGFLKEAKKELKPLGVDISIDIFGLVTTNTHDMGIGQKLIEISEDVDYICPMVYPSHYNPGEYNLKDPDTSPYETVYFSLSGARKRLGDNFVKVRPYLQDFSIKSRYGAKEVREQIQAAYDNDMPEWLLWNPRCKYSEKAFKSKEHTDKYEKSGRPAPKYNYPQKKKTAAVETSSTTVKPSDTPVKEEVVTEQPAQEDNSAVQINISTPTAQ